MQQPLQRLTAQSTDKDVVVSLLKTAAMQFLPEQHTANSDNLWRRMYSMICPAYVCHPLLPQNVRMSYCYSPHLHTAQL